MKRNLSLLITLFLVFVFTTSALAEDIYVYYITKDPNGRAIDTKIYSKNGDVRVEVDMNMAGMQISTASLLLKKNPNEIVILIPQSKSYTKTLKPKKKIGIEKNFTIKVIGKEKVGAYNCTRVKIQYADKSFDMWYTKDLPALNLPIQNNQVAVDKKIMDELEKKGVSGMMVKTIYYNPGTTAQKFSMELAKYESKPLNAALFKIPSDYKEGKGNPFPVMSPEKRKEMIKQMMDQAKKKQQ